MEQLLVDLYLNGSKLYFPYQTLVTQPFSKNKPVKLKTSCFAAKSLPVSWDLYFSWCCQSKLQGNYCITLSWLLLDTFSFVFVGSSWKVRCALFAGIDGHSHTSDSPLGRWASRYCTRSWRCDPRRSCTAQLVSVCFMWQWQDTGTTSHLFSIEVQ